MAHRTELIPAETVAVGATILFPNGASLTVAQIERHGDEIDFRGTINTHSVFDGDSTRQGSYSQFVGENVPVIGDKY